MASGLRRALAEVVVPVGVAAAAGIVVAATISPHWQAAGAPYFLGYGKNVEAAAVVAGLAAGAATQWLVRTRAGLAACVLVAALGLTLAAALVPIAPLLAGWPRLLAIAVLATAFGAGRHGRQVAGAGPPLALPAAARTAGGGRDLPAVAAALVVGGLAAAVFALTVGPRVAGIDTYHQGEVLSTAVDLLRGGRPFATLIWPHGLHDTGLTALWIAATGKVGTSPVALAWATCCAFGVVATYLVARRLLGSRVEALALCLAVALAPLLKDEPQWGPAARMLDQLGGLLFVALAFAAMTSRSRHRELVAGVCLGLGYLFRVEAAVYGALAALAVIAVPAALTATGATAAAGRMRAAGRMGAFGAPAPGADRGAEERGTPWRAALAAAAASVLWLALGVVLVLGAARLVLGWPGAEWYAYTLRDLPRYHRDAMGYPLPWPRRGVELPPAETDWLSAALARLLLTLLLLVQALREILGWARTRAGAAPGSGKAAGDSTTGDSTTGGSITGDSVGGAAADDSTAVDSAAAGRLAQVVFVAVFAAAAVKSALDRSDTGHVLQWSALPMLAVLCLAVAGWRDRRAWLRPRSCAALFVLVVLFDYGGLGFGLPALRGPGALRRAAGERWHGLVEHLAPNPPVGACADRTFTPAESRLAANRAFIADTCTMERLLRGHGIARLVVADSASWYYVRFRAPFPTRYFALARAYTPPLQRQLIRELRASRPQALLVVRGYGAIGDFDVPDAVRVPVVDAYLRGRRDGVAATPTPLGDLFLWDEPDAPKPAVNPKGRSSGEAAPRAELGTDLVAYQPMSGSLFARGWAIDAATRLPLAALLVRGAPPGAVAALELGRHREPRADDRRCDLPPEAGWELAIHGWPPPGGPGVPGVPGAGAAGSPGQAAGAAAALDLEAVAADGRTTPVELDLSQARILGQLDGPEWDGLAAAIDRAASQGRADRAAALERAKGTQPPAGR